MTQQMDTIVDLFGRVLERDPDQSLLTYRDQSGEWRDMTVREFELAVYRRARALHVAGVQPDSDIALISENRPEWHMYDFAILGLGASTVPIHANMSPEQTAYVLEDSESTHLIVSNRKLLSKVLTGFGGTGHLEKIIVLEPPDTIPEHDVIGEPELMKVTEQYSDRTLKEFWDLKKKQVDPHSLATLIYTSGTTGVPKGVMLTHHNITSNLLACYEVLQFEEDAVGLSFLPLSHAFERLIDYAYLYCGSRIAYGTPDTITEDMREVQPDQMASVPRLFEKVKAKVEERVQASGTIKKSLFRWALDVGYRATSRSYIEGKEVPKGLEFKQWIANTFILQSVHKAMGGNLKLVVSGGAALDEEVCNFLLSLSIPVIEGYGMTEMSPVVSMNRLRSLRPGTVGKPLPGVDVRIGEDGEILARGPNMMKGYYRKYDESVEALRDGWFHTGDVGEFDEEGNLMIRGRARFSIVTSWGENVIPQPLEQELRKSPFIEYAILIGHNRNFISALIQPDFKYLKEWGSEQNLPAETRRELLELPEVKEAIEQEVHRIQDDWADYEQVKAFRLLPEQFTVKNGYLTPTMKVRRHVLMEDYADLVEEMYAGEPEEAPTGQQ